MRLDKREVLKEVGHNLVAQHTRTLGAKEVIMAKGQIRSNKEKKKPKGSKVPAGAATTKGGLPPIKIPSGKS